MAYTSFGTRKALGRRYGVDPALLMESERLQAEYNLAPGREARGMQASQFAQGLELQREQMAGAERGGMVGTAGNLLTTGAMLRAMTMEKGAPFFVNPFAAKAAGVTPAMMGYEAGATGLAGPAAAGAGFEAGATGAAVTGAAPTAAPAAGMLSYAAPVAAGYLGGQIGERLGVSIGERIGIGGQREREIVGGTLGGAAAGAATGAAIGATGGPIGALAGAGVGAAVGFVSSIFGFKW